MEGPSHTHTLSEHREKPPGQLLRLQNLPGAARWVPGCTVGPFTHTHTHAHTHTDSSLTLFTIATHMLSKPLYKWRRCNTHGYMGGPDETPRRWRVPALYTEPLQAQVRPTARYNSLGSQGWDANRWRCFLY